jgi:hypothetical protein
MGWAGQLRILGKWKVGDYAFAERWEAERALRKFMQHYEERRWVEALRIVRIQRPVSAHWDMECDKLVEGPRPKK